ncbi:class I SAM-dependent methyltransferase [Pseudoalteromonas ulvae]|uniref:Methyltransferase n=1 Tax=Pseudoalteromonas ulvae TaxID=107327 RepID=A0A244CP07_PSEDV|nr:class I SAM-dependent methyltransferase [Pseudoalteromonas ulvae]OUL57315.1 methyltransferase [Pseudoalteromonas ulvae]
MTLSCTLCDSTEVTHFFTDKHREYVQCKQCSLVFVPAQFHLTAEQEKALYDKHENHIEDKGYQAFLSRVVSPLQTYIAPQSDGLDFGCGPGPALAHMLTGLGHTMSVYDIFYAPQTDVLTTQYDFVTCTEVIEHFHTPAKEWTILTELVKPQGTLAVMTKLVIDKDRFSNWHYKSDLTHVSFFSQTTFKFLAQRDGLSVEFFGNDVILFKKP